MDKNKILHEDAMDSSVNHFESIIESIMPKQYQSGDDEITSIQLENAVDDAIDELEKLLSVEALTDDEWAELFDADEELHDDITILDFD